MLFLFAYNHQEHDSLTIDNGVNHLEGKATISQPTNQLRKQATDQLTKFPERKKTAQSYKDVDRYVYRYIYTVSICFFEL